MVPQLPALIFDLDGTLTDSKPGILGCLRKVLDARGLGDCGPLDRFVGPPVEEWAIELLPNGSEADRVALAREYRDCYNREGWSNNSVYAGIGEALTALRERGFPLYVCTSKQQLFAERILQYFELAGFFIAIYGDKPEFEDHSKGKLLARLLADRGLGHATAWMIGDRIYDIAAAKENGIRSIAAAWGYGSQEEWAQADAIAPTPADVLTIAVK
jgi:phosphoglycolate phosphatase